MDTIAEELIVSLISFVKHTGGIIHTPYTTYRRVIDTGRNSEVLFLGLLCLLYFSLASLVKTQAFRPFLLTRQFLQLSIGAAVGYFFIVGVLYFSSIAVGGKGNWKKVALGWGYSLLPTLVWFFTTSILYVLVPPPRTHAPLGILFSFIYLIFSAILFFWKVELYYLTLRFGMRLDLRKIILVSFITLPLLCIYSFVMYQLGIFRVPFI